jgi:hypothetical protein
MKDEPKLFKMEDDVMIQIKGKRRGQEKMSNGTICRRTTIKTAAKGCRYGIHDEFKWTARRAQRQEYFVSYSCCSECGRG